VREIEGDGQRPIELSLFGGWKRGNETRQLVLEQQHEKVTPNRARLRETLLGSDYDLGIQPEKPAIDRSANYGRDIIGCSDKRA
jgi:hypothetical protein